MPQAAEALNSKNLTKSACCPIIPGIWPLDAESKLFLETESKHRE